ncbi:MAG: FMN-binding protein, partial [Candidatus Nitrosotenuis sp.]
TTSTTKKATSSSSSTSSSTSSNSSTNSSTDSSTNNGATQSATPALVATKAAAPAAVSGSFTGDAINVGYGMVQVKITVSNGKITEATAVQAPSGRSQRFTDYSVPNLRQQTLRANSAAITGVSGASYTSYGWYKSLISALQKAGMPTGA